MHTTGMNEHNDKKKNYGKLTNAHLKLIRSLELKKHREKHNLFVIEGEKMISDILKTNIKIRTIFALKECTDSLSILKHFEKELIIVNNNELKKISFLSSPNRILAIAEKSSLPFRKYDPNKPSILLDTIQDPGNFGTILRTACWYGIDQVVCSPKTADYLNPKVVQSSMGAFAHINVMYKDLKAFLNNHNANVYGATIVGENINNVNFAKNSIILIGNESKGISKDILSFLNKKITIPKYGPMESLNAAIATAVICDKFRRDHPPH